MITLVEGRIGLFLPEPLGSGLKRVIAGAVESHSGLQEFSQTPQQNMIWMAQTEIVRNSQEFEERNWSGNPPEVLLCTIDNLPDAIALLDANYTFSKSRILLVGPASPEQLKLHHGNFDFHLPAMARSAEPLLQALKVLSADAAKHKALDHVVFDTCARNNGPYKRFYDNTTGHNGSILLLTKPSTDYGNFKTELNGFEVVQASPSDIQTWTQTELARFNAVLIDRPLFDDKESWATLGKIRAYNPARICLNSSGTLNPISDLPEIDGSLNSVFQLTAFMKREHLRKITGLIGEGLNHLHQKAYYDELTSLPNRHLLPLYIESISANFKADPSSPRGCYLFIGDLDKFKGVNDIYGHDAGDKVLKETAEEFRSSARTQVPETRSIAPENSAKTKAEKRSQFIEQLSDDGASLPSEHEFHLQLLQEYGGVDFVGRWGGEEFIFIVYTDDPLIAQKVMQRAREALENTTIAIPLSPEEFSEIYKNLHSKNRLYDRGNGVWETHGQMENTPYRHLKYLRQTLEGCFADLRISFSAGGVRLDLANPNVSEARQKADTLLYAAKAAGRNRVAYDPHEFGFLAPAPHLQQRAHTTDNPRLKPH